MRTKDVCLIALLSATLTAGKFALSFIANVEVVTLFLVVYALTLPRSRVLIATVTFVLTETLLHGAHVWIIMYLIHWPALVLAVSFLKGKKAPLFAIIIGILFTVIFGVQTTLIEVLTFLNYKKVGFWTAFAARYATGISFFVVHIVSNTCILSVLVYPMYRLMKSLYRQYFMPPARNAVRKGLIEVDPVKPPRSEDSLSSATQPEESERGSREDREEKPFSN